MPPTDWTQPLELEHRRITLPDGTSVLAAGKDAPETPLVLILHGIVSHLGWYEGLAAALSRAGASAWLVDRRGSGRSDGPRGHAPSWRTLVDDTVHVIRTLTAAKPDREVHLVGISLGGVLSLATDLLHPGLIKRQAVLCPGLASRIRLPMKRRLRLLLRSFTRPTRLYDIPFTVEMLSESRSWRQAISTDPLRCRGVSARFLVGFFHMQRYVARHITSLRSPTRCLLASEDAIIDNDGVLRILRRAGSPMCLEVFEGAHHVLPASVPGEVLADRISEWLLSASLPTFNGVRHTAVEALVARTETGPLPFFLKGSG